MCPTVKQKIIQECFDEREDVFEELTRPRKSQNLTLFEHLWAALDKYDLKH